MKEIIDTIESWGWEVEKIHIHNKRFYVLKIYQKHFCNFDVKDFNRFDWCYSVNSTNQFYSLNGEDRNAKIKIEF